MFSFEHTHRWSEAEYIRIWSLVDVTPRAQYVRRAIIVLAGVACLFWSYTILLGAAILVMALILAVIPRLVPSTSAHNFREMRYLKSPITYGADDQSLWVQTTDFHAKVGWQHVTVWRERDGWLVLQGNGFPPVVLPIDALEAQGIYGPIKRLAEEHASMFR